MRTLIAALCVSSVSVFLAACDDNEYINEAEPIKTLYVKEVGNCTPQQTTWDRTVRSECAALMSDGSVQVIRAPVMVGMKRITCPPKTNNIDNSRCVYWNGARPKVPKGQNGQHQS